jgi:hypothetical protein
LTCENGYKVTPEEVQQDAVETARAGTILDRDGVFWKRFIYEGRLNESALLEKGYTEGQLPSIKAEMKRLKWL